ncbi:MAG: hypothetical protein V3V14_01955 [Saprospiraceae bacterium]
MLLICFIGTYIITFPQGFLIADVYSYFNMSTAIIHGETYPIYNEAISGQPIKYNITNYPLGNSVWIAFWRLLFGTPYVYIGSLFSFAFGTFLIYQSIAKRGFQTIAILLFFIFPAFLFFCKSLMSGVPSFLLSCLFIYLLFTKGDTGRKWFLLSMIAGLSIWFREANILLLGGICLIHFLGDKRWFWYYVAGTFIGLSPRLFTSQYYYSDYFYQVLAESFSLSNITDNFVIYGLLTIVFMPIGLYVLSVYKGRYRYPIVISSMLFLLLYFTYSFNATIYSGFNKGLITMGRFILPVLPFYVMAAAWRIRDLKIKNHIRVISYLVVVGLVIGSQIVIDKEASIHKSISTHIYNNYSNKCVIFDLSNHTNIVRYANPQHGSFLAQTDITNLKDTIYVNRLIVKYNEVYILQTVNVANQAKVEKTQKVTNYIKTASIHFDVNLVEKLPIKSGLSLEIYRIVIKKNDAERLGI